MEDSALGLSDLSPHISLLHLSGEWRAFPYVGLHISLLHLSGAWRDFPYIGLLCVPFRYVSSD